MKLAAIIVQYWYMHVDAIEKILDIGWKRHNIMNMIRWNALYYFLNVLAFVLGYGSTKNPAFIHHAMTYKIKRRNDK